MLLVGCMRILSSHLCFCLRVFVGTRCSHSYLSMPFFVSSQVRGIDLPLSCLQPLEPPSFSSCQSATVSLFQLSLLCLYGVAIVFLPPSVPVLRRLPPLSSLSLSLSVLSRFRLYLASVFISLPSPSPIFVYGSFLLLLVMLVLGLVWSHGLFWSHGLSSGRSELDREKRPPVMNLGQGPVVYKSSPISRRSSLAVIKPVNGLFLPKSIAPAQPVAFFSVSVLFGRVHDRMTAKRATP